MKSAAAATARARVIAGVLVVVVAGMPLAAAQGGRMCEDGVEVSDGERIVFPDHGASGACGLVDDYPDDQSCGWHLHCEDPAVPQLVFDYILTEAGFDFVKAYEGTPEGTVLVFEHAGHMPRGHSVTFSENDGLLLFESDGSNGDMGFQANFTCVPPEDPCRSCTSGESVAGVGFEVRCGELGRCEEDEHCATPREEHEIACCRGGFLQNLAEDVAQLHGENDEDNMQNQNQIGNNEVSNQIQDLRQHAQDLRQHAQDLQRNNGGFDQIQNLQQEAQLLEQQAQDLEQEAQNLHQEAPQVLIDRTHWRSSAGCPVEQLQFSYPNCPGEFDVSTANEFCRAQSGGRLCTAGELENDCAASTGCWRHDDLLWSSTPCVYGFLGSAAPAEGDPCAGAVEVFDQQSITFSPTGDSQSCEWKLRCTDPAKSAQLVFFEFGIDRGAGENVRAYDGLSAEPSSFIGTFFGSLYASDGHRVAFSGSDGLLQFTAHGPDEVSSTGFQAILECVPEDGPSPCRECVAPRASQPDGSSSNTSQPDGSSIEWLLQFSVFCPAGMYSNENKTACIGCEAGKSNSKSGQDGPDSCEDCEVGRYSEPQATECQTEAEYFRCPDKTRQISNSELLTETCRDADGSVVSQSELPSQCTRCTCTAGYYDAADFQINCWKFDKKFDKNTPARITDTLNTDSVLDINAHNQFESKEKAEWASTCVRCPDCVDCSGGSDWQHVTIKEGYGLVTAGVSELDSGEKVLDVFTCPLTGSCLNLSIADVLDNGANSRSCATGYTSAPDVPFCAYCENDNYIKENNECTECKAVRSGSAPILIAVAAALVIGVVSSLRLRFTPHHFQVTAALLRLMWPLLAQMGKLIITNYQILSGLPERLRIPFPPGITKLLKKMTTMINIDVLTLPGVGCIVGSSFYTKFLANMLTPLFLVILALILSKQHLKRLKTTTMPMPKDLEVDLDSIGPVGDPERRKIVHRRINFKICRAVVGSKVQAPYFQFICFIVYLRYPAVAKLVFYMFRCRTVGSDTELLEADYTQTCYEGTHQIFAVLAAFFLCAYVIGIPAFILYVLTRFQTTIVGQAQSPDYRPAVGKEGEKGYKPQVGKEEIPGNRNYIGVAHFKPLFQFYKSTPATYRFEMYFWIEKVLLVGFTEMFGNVVNDSTGITQWLLNMAVTLTFLTLIASYKPWEAHGTYYNAAYVFMHLIMIYFYIVSLLLNPRVNLAESAVDNLEFIDASLIVSQCALGAFMVLATFVKISHLWHEARAQVHAERTAEAKVKEHTLYFEQLRLYFSDRVAIALTNAHHYGGFGAVLGDMSSSRKLGGAMGDVRHEEDDFVPNPMIDAQTKHT